MCGRAGGRVSLFASSGLELRLQPYFLVSDLVNVEHFAPVVGRLHRSDERANHLPNRYEAESVCSVPS